MTAAPIKGPNGNVWTCDHCGRASTWTSAHAAYGAVIAEDHPQWSHDCGCRTARLSHFTTENEDA